MKMYWFYLLDAKDTPIRAYRIDVDSDEEALAKVEEFREGATGELFEGGRKVKRY